MPKNYLIKCCFIVLVFATIAKLQFSNRNIESMRFSERSFRNKKIDDIQRAYKERRRWFLRNMNFKYILHWTSPKVEPFFGTGVAPFTRANCSRLNCVVTKDKSKLKDIRKFDAIIFHGPDFWYNPSLIDRLPSKRSKTQKYIYYSGESADYYPMCDADFNDFFNLTWTYKLNSDLPFPYFIVRDSKGYVIGPDLEMHWKKEEEMLEIDNNLKEKLQGKRLAVAWLVSICQTASKREVFADELRAKLILLYGLNLDMFGNCSGSYYKCGRPDLLLPSCWEIFQEEYYFYLSFENSFDEDYVTEKVLNALQNYVVPIVYGAANYSRFLPEGSYLDARKLGVAKLAEEINDIIANKERYYSFFKWHNHYSFHSVYESPETNPICALCEMLNVEGWMKTYPDFTSWWNIDGRCPQNSRPETTEILFV